MFELAEILQKMMAMTILSVALSVFLKAKPLYGQMSLVPQLCGADTSTLKDKFHNTSLKYVK
jgi:hypothetical protein